MQPTFYISDESSVFVLLEGDSELQLVLYFLVYFFGIMDVTHFQ
jgi:hypothetical protein